ncbi:hypothetical protein RhiirC2_845447 [Rhizophagus irregularis]|uniref:Uncharacterized protein n=1 Tax=Rhizophagus irregularis TaxID=588596 RepID=A0A2N1NQL3_9GLOM|nr:hypothetical protein RhiirC2_845447 [Rhizophagus irregularis]
MIYIEKDIALTIKGRIVNDEKDQKVYKPYMTSENIYLRNEIVSKDKITDLYVKKSSEMKIDSVMDDMVFNSMKWIEFIMEKSDAYDIIKNFVLGKMKQFVDKEVVLQIGGIEVDKFNFEGKIVSVKNERKIYIVALIIAVIMLLCNIMIDLRTDLKIALWLSSYSEMGSTRRELDDGLYIFEFDKYNLGVKKYNIKGYDARSETTSIKKRVKNKESIAEIKLKMDNLIVDEYSLCWNNVPIEGAFRSWFKGLSNNITKIDVILLDYDKDCFIEANGANIFINWKESFRLINNEVTTSKNVTSRNDASIRTWRVKNFLKLLPTYETLWKRAVWGIPSTKYPRCTIEDETWEHIWICMKNNGVTEMALLKKSINKVLSDDLNVNEAAKQRPEFEEQILDVASTISNIMTTEGLEN